MELRRQTCRAVGRGRNSEENDPTGHALGTIVAAAFGLRVAEIRSAGRGSAEVSFARQVAMYLAHTRLCLPFGATGRLFGRDRTTARHACRQVEDRREDPRVDALIDCLERAVELSIDLGQFHPDRHSHAG